MSNIFLYFRIIYLTILVSLTSLFEIGLNIGSATFLIPSILMGLGVAIDVFIATVVQFKDENLSWKSWTLPVTVTHTLFPAIGYFLFWNLSVTLPFAKAALGLIGFILVALFIYEVLCEAAGFTPLFGISRTIGNSFSLKISAAHTFITIMAVSWDALWSGPAKAAQAATGNWATSEVVLSFMIAGLVVALMAELALTVAKQLRRYEFKNAHSLARFNVIGKYIELSVIGGFGILSLWHAFSDSATLYNSITIMAIVLGIVFMLLKKPLKENQLNEARDICTD